MAGPSLRWRARAPRGADRGGVLPRVWRVAWIAAVAALLLGGAGTLRAQPASGPFTLERMLGRGLVRSVAWSPAGDRIAVGGALGIWLYTPDLSDMGVLQGHTRAVYGLAFSPDGKYLASASHDQTVRVWDLAAQTERLRLEGHRGLVVAVAWRPSGDLIATGAYDGTVRLWEAATGAPLRVLTGPADWVSDVVFSPGEAGVVAAASYDGTIWAWCVLDGATVAVLRGHVGPVLALDWTAQGTLISAGQDRTVRGWTLFPPAQAWALATEHSAAVHDLAWHPAGQRLATASADGTVRLWEARAGRAVGRFEAHTGQVQQLAWSPDGTRLATLGWDDTVRVWSVAEDRLIAVRDDHLDFIVALAWEGGAIHAQTLDGRHIGFDAATGAVIGAELLAQGEPLPVAWPEAAGRRVAVDEGGVVRVLEAGSGAILAELPGRANAAVWSPDGERLAVALRNGTIAIWKAEGP